MYLGVTFLVLVLHQPYQINTVRACVPNTYFIANGRLCFCDHQGRWTESNCKSITRRQQCIAGQIIWQGCSQCVCQDNGQLLCTSAYCSNQDINTPISHKLAEYGPRCTPFRSYYVNCSLCFCPASGQASDAQCAVDTSCLLNHTSDILTISKRNQCIPNVMYLFPCIQCLCSENGFFVLDKCLVKCQSETKHKRRCIPGTLYRKDCDICRCPSNSITDEKLCIKNVCNVNNKQTYLHSLRSGGHRCTPNSFTKPKCIYCDCNSEGTVNEHSCLELDCSKISDFKYYTHTNICSPGELVPICMECFCLSNGLTNESYCTRMCTYQSKLNVLEKVLNDRRFNVNLIDKTKIKTVRGSERCEPGTLYLENNRYCLCSDEADTSLKFCTSISEKPKFIDSRIKIKDNTSCEPNTLVDFDCNTCYCSKSGTIDPKWCTYDDCEAKRIVMESHKRRPTPSTIEDPSGACIPGSISKVKCNFCICPESGVLKDRACTKNDCFAKIDITNNKFTCEPLAYYEVDCNVCFCPSDGHKNVAKCTKNQCEKGFLRSDSCIAGHLFTDDCNVCVCPPNGDKADRVCTNHTCGIPSWNTFKLSSSLLENQVQDDATRNLDLCFPGEEFSMGCNLCVCPELGLKVYAPCEPILCDGKTKDEAKLDFATEETQLQKVDSNTTDIVIGSGRTRIRRAIGNKCYTYELSQSSERQDCTPGAMYIIRCKQCICPYIGNIINFCRPLPKTFFCEEAFPGFNYLAMGRRDLIKESNTDVNATVEVKGITVIVKHLYHTIHPCSRPGKVMDECFVCDCEENVIIEEHCFKSDAEKCANATSTFFGENKPTLL